MPNVRESVLSKLLSALYPTDIVHIFLITQCKNLISWFITLSPNHEYYFSFHSSISWTCCVSVANRPVLMGQSHCFTCQWHPEALKEDCERYLVSLFMSPVHKTHFHVIAMTLLTSTEFYSFLRWLTDSHTLDLLHSFSICEAVLTQ